MDTQTNEAMQQVIDDFVMDAKCPHCPGDECEQGCYIDYKPDWGIEISCKTVEFGFRVRYGGGMEFSFLNTQYHSFTGNFICLSRCCDGHRDNIELANRFNLLCDMLRNEPDQFTTTQLDDVQLQQLIHAVANIFTPSGEMTKGI